MPTEAVRRHLNALYAASGDPWNAFTSGYERAKFGATMAAVPRPRYRQGLEVGCGVGALTRRLAPRCEALTAVDCTARAIASARALAAAANVTFVHGTVPAVWSAVPPNLVVVSEVLYFMTLTEIDGLAGRLIDDVAARADLLLVNWLGDTGGAVDGAAAAGRLIERLGAGYAQLATKGTAAYRIDVLRRT